MRKSWTLSYYQTEALAHFLDNLLCEIHNGTAALILTDGKPLHVHTVHPADTATLPAAAAQCFQYFQLKDGEVAICNDPYAGGTRLSDITLVMGVTFESPGDAADVLLAVRLRFPPRVSLVGKLDEEGIRIPPMPVFTANKLNKDVLNAMAAAPNVPGDLVQKVEHAVSELLIVRENLKACGKDPQNELRKANFKRYFQDCHDIAAQMFHGLPLGETLVTGNLENGELTKLRLEVMEKKVIFDFSGTESSKSVQLTDLATFGACFTILQNVLGQKIPANAGVFSCIELHAPARTWVNAKAPAATTRGVSDGLAFIGNLGQKAFAKLDKNLRTGTSAIGSGHVQFAFENGKFLSDSTPGGTGAGDEHNGVDGWNYWLNCDHKQSLEEVEQNYPVQVRSVAIRPHSGGRGKWIGGDGLIKSYQVLAPAKVTWALEQASHKPEGAETGKSGVTAEACVQRAGKEEKEELKAEGTIDLQPGDTFLIFSAGGGGYGAPASSEAST